MELFLNKIKERLRASLFLLQNFRKKFNKTIDIYVNDWYNKYRKEVER